MVEDLIYKSLKRLLGDGLAWALRAVNVENVLKAMLSICVDIRRYYIRVSRLPFPTVQSGLLPDDSRTDAEWKDDISNLERVFDMTPNFADSLEHRATVAEAQWGLIGSNARGYIQQALTDAGIPVYVKENIPAIDLFAQSATQYDSEDFGFVNYSSGNQDLLGNGLITTEEKTYDPVAKPMSVFEQYGYSQHGTNRYGEYYDQWLNVFIIEGEAWQEKVTLTQSQYDSMIYILLKVKPLGKLAWLNVQVQ